MYYREKFSNRLYKSLRDELNFLEKILDIKFTRFTLGFQIDNTVGNVFIRLENDTDIGSRATEMCPNIKDIEIWLSALEKL